MNLKKVAIIYNDDMSMAPAEEPSIGPWEGVRYSTGCSSGSGVRRVAYSSYPFEGQSGRFFKDHQTREC